MIVLAKGDVVLPDRVLSEGTIIIDAGRIAAIETGAVDPGRATTIDASDCYIVPGFIDVHVHGVEGYDTLDGGESVRKLHRGFRGTVLRHSARRRSRVLRKSSAVF
jgi:N-acetylglucosamine-6-phosphate deacetylase